MNANGHVGPGEPYVASRAGMRIAATRVHDAATAPGARRFGGRHRTAIPRAVGPASGDSRAARDLPGSRTIQGASGAAVRRAGARRVPALRRPRARLPATPLRRVRSRPTRPLLVQAPRILPLVRRSPHGGSAPATRAGRRATRGSPRAARRVPRWRGSGAGRADTALRRARPGCRPRARRAPRARDGARRGPLPDRFRPLSAPARSQTRPWPRAASAPAYGGGEGQPPSGGFRGELADRRRS